MRADGSRQKDKRQRFLLIKKGTSTNKVNNKEAAVNEDSVHGMDVD